MRYDHSDLRLRGDALEAHGLGNVLDGIGCRRCIGIEHEHGRTRAGDVNRMLEQGRDLLLELG